MDDRPQDCGSTVHGGDFCREVKCATWLEMEERDRTTKVSVTDISRSMDEINAPETVKMAADRVEPEGLQRVFIAGEMLPWKKITFEVEHVGPDRIVLRPLSTTSAFRKKKARGQAT